MTRCRCAAAAAAAAAPGRRGAGVAAGPRRIRRARRRGPGPPRRADGNVTRSRNIVPTIFGAQRLGRNIWGAIFRILDPLLPPMGRNGHGCARDGRPGRAARPGSPSHEDRQSELRRQAGPIFNPVTPPIIPTPAAAVTRPRTGATEVNRPSPCRTGFILTMPGRVYFDHAG